MTSRQGAFVQDVTCQPDPCLSQERSILRFAVLALLFLTMFGTALLLKHSMTVVHCDQCKSPRAIYAFFEPDVRTLELAFQRVGVHLPT